ncbi:AMP-binding protein [Nocardia asteroides]|uniref:AMP-binding protein n=1 Tax=Nocardia asteroides TaxID=1824 RepID=UPI001E59F3B3|nr:AMP-binding protein [Nocardia asteroides]UGT59959.1 AMP-binding protein [Nocardia asteroides]
MSTSILDVVALSPLQRGLYSVSATSGDVDPYLVTFAVRVDGLADLGSLRKAFDQVLERYPHLGGAVVTDGLPHPVLVTTSAGRIGWRELDLRGEPDPAAAARRLYLDEGRTRIDLDAGPLFRVVAARVGPQEYELVCTAHHIVVDGWSIPLIFADLLALHRGEGAGLPPAPPLREHAAWLASRDTEASAGAWTAALAGLAPMPMIAGPAPADIPVLGEARLTPERTAAVTGWARAHGLTLNTVLQLAWARVLSALTGRDDVVFGQTTSGRDGSLPNADRLVGALVTTIPVRVRLDGRAPAEIGGELQKEVARLRAHEYLGIAEITKRAGVGQLFDTLLVFENTPMGDITARMPLGDGATLVPRRIDSPSHYPIAVVPVLEQGSLINRVEIRPDLVRRFEPDALAERVLAVLERITGAARAADVAVLLDGEPAALAAPDAVAVPGDVPHTLLAAVERFGDRSAVVDEVGEHSYAQFGAAVLALAAGLAARGVGPGSAVAVALPRDRRVLHAPFAIGLTGATCVHVDPATPPDRLAYIAETSGARLVLADAALADVLAEAGLTHLVPDNAGNLRELPATPSSAASADATSRSAGNTASAPLTIAGRSSAAQGEPPAAPGESPAAPGESPAAPGESPAAPGESPAAPGESPAAPGESPAAPGESPAAPGESPAAPGYGFPPVPAENPFYVVFTSGTTGRPKGVAVPHRALLNHWGNHERRIFAPESAAAGRPLRIGHGWSTGFDAAWQPSIALLSGHTVVLLGDDERTDAERIVAAIATNGIDIFDTSPSMLNRLVAAGLLTARDGREYCPLRVLALGGEAISQDTWNRLRGLADTRVINFYGPTETTVEALMADVHEHEAPTIGHTFGGMTAEVLDHRLRPVPPGGQGELYLSGAQLAHGYLRRAGQTAATFVAGPAGRRYRTGDLVRRTRAGTVVYEGRIDSQVKINGYRVEPDEATAVLREIPGVRHAAALAFTAGGRTRLGALVVADRPATAIRAAAARRLPRFLVPTRIVHVAEIPLNRNDKLDTHAATALLTAPVATGAAAEPGTETERALLGVLAEMHAGSAGILDSLVDLGIDSIGVIDLVSRLRGAGYRVAARDVLGAADLRELAALLDGAGEPDAGGEVLAAGAVLPLTALALEIIGQGGYQHLTQSQVLTLPPGVDPAGAEEVLRALATAHPALRSRLGAVDGVPALIVLAPEEFRVEVAVAAPGSATPRELLAATVDRLDPAAGRMVAATVLTGAEPRLLLSVHHLAVDVVSWLILADDLRGLADGRAPLVEYAQPGAVVPAAAEPLPVLGTPLAGRLTDPVVDRAADAHQHLVELDPERTAALLARCAASDVPLEEALIVACARAFDGLADAAGRVAITRESHGRPADDDSRRVGWFTVEETVTVPGAVVAEWSPAAGRPALAERSTAVRGQLRLNHLGRFDQLTGGRGPWAPVPMAEFTAEFGIAQHPELPLRFTVDITTVVVQREGAPVLVGQFDINGAVLGSAAAAECSARWRAVVSALAE